MIGRSPPSPSSTANDREHPEDHRHQGAIRDAAYPGSMTEVEPGITPTAGNFSGPFIECRPEAAPSLPATHESAKPDERRRQCDDIVNQVIKHWSDTTIRTHSVECWEWHPHCAIAILANEIERLRARTAEQALVHDAWLTERALADQLAEALRIVVRDWCPASVRVPVLEREARREW
jgi:hypothetical protein